MNWIRINSWMRLNQTWSSSIDLPTENNVQATIIKNIEHYIAIEERNIRSNAR
jgi:hypothetical protein